MTSTCETFAFQAEINQLMSLIVNTFYSNKDVFLRELISNASDANDKARYTYMQSPDSYANRGEHSIKLRSFEPNTLCIEDDGIGMTRQDMIDNLGTIANSGTRSFMEAIKDGADASMIGQFGVGFYSAYLVAKEVCVISRHIDSKETYRWTSNAGGSFTIELCGENDAMTNAGTRVVLKVKEGCEDYLKEDTLRRIVKQHSEYISYSIQLFTTRVEKSVEEEPEEDAKEGEVVEVNEDDKKEKKEVERTVEEWVTINTGSPLWCKKPEDITKEEYGAFYKGLSSDWDEHIAEKHFKAEGQSEFTGLLFIPKRAPFDMFKAGQKTSKVKLYVKRVLIMDDCDKLLPEWLSFVHGVVDSDDIPLNVSREMLQQNTIVKMISRTLVKKCVEMMEELADHEDKSLYKTFYENFHQSIKLGVHEDTKMRDRLTKLLRFESANRTDPTSLEDFALETSGDTIYYITGSSRKNVERSPFVEGVKKRGFDVLFMLNPIDEYMVQTLREFEGKKLVNVTKDNELFHETDEDLEKGVCERIKTVLSDHIDKVVVSNRLGNVPCCLVSGQYGWSANMERIMKAQTLGSMHSLMGGGDKKIMEINPKHPLIRKLHSDAELSEDIVTNTIHVMYDTALMLSGYSHEDPSVFSDRIFRMLSAGLQIDDTVEEEAPVVPEASQTTEEEGDMEQLD